MSGGGYGNYFTQYQSLPTNLQNYVGGQGSPSLMNQQGGQMGGAPSFGWQQAAPQRFGGNPFMSRSPYSFMGSMGRNFGGPATNYNNVARGMAGPLGYGAAATINPFGTRIPKWTPPPPREPWKPFNRGHGGGRGPGGVSSGAGDGGAGAAGTAGTGGGSGVGGSAAGGL